MLDRDEEHGYDCDNDEQGCDRDYDDEGYLLDLLVRHDDRDDQANEQG